MVCLAHCVGCFCCCCFATQLSIVYFLFLCHSVGDFPFPCHRHSACGVEIEMVPVVVKRRPAAPCLLVWWLYHRWGVVVLVGGGLLGKEYLSCVCFPSSVQQDAWLSGVVVDGPKTYNTMVQDNPGENASQDPPAKKTVDRKQK